MTGTVPIRGLVEAHLTVADLGRSTAFYRDTAGLSVALEVPERGAVFFWVGAPGQAMLGLWWRPEAGIVPWSEWRRP